MSLFNLSEHCHACHHCILHVSWGLPDEVTPLAKACGLHDVFWGSDPDDVKLVRAHKLVPQLVEGLEKLNLDPKRYSSEGKRLEETTRSLLETCKEHPHALFEAWP